jgi:serine/threonine-protein kinase
MSPEQLRGGALDGRSDLYALGVVLFEMLTGRLPFDAATPEQHMAAHLEALPPPPSQLADVPHELDALVTRLLAKDAAARPASAEQLSELLAAAIGEAPATAVGGKRSDPPVGGRAVVAANEGRVRAVLAGAIVAVVALTTIVVALHGKHAPSAARAPETHEAPLPVAHAKNPSTNAQNVTGDTAARADDARSVPELEHAFLTMKSPLPVRDRRAALRDLAAHIDASGGTVDERARKHRAALIELIRQHAN